MKIWSASLLWFALGISIFLNISQHLTIGALTYKIQKLEAGPAQGLFLDRETPLPKESDQELNELLKRMIKQMLRERTV